MGPKSESPQSDQLSGYPLVEHLNPHHPLLRLAKLIDWRAIDEAVSSCFPSIIQDRLGKRPSQA